MDERISGIEDAKLQYRCALERDVLKGRIYSIEDERKRLHFCDKGDLRPLEGLVPGK